MRRWKRPSALACLTSPAYLTCPSYSRWLHSGIASANSFSPDHMHMRFGSLNFNEAEPLVKGYGPLVLKANR